MEIRSSDGKRWTWPSPPPFRDPNGVPGDFYAEGDCCINCGVPESLAPDLIGRSGGESRRCAWKKQPSTMQELDQAISVLNMQELGCHRYGGTDPSILAWLDREVCDYPLPMPVSEPQRREVLPKFEFVRGESVLARIWRGLLPSRRKKD